MPNFVIAYKADDGTPCELHFDLQKWVVGGDQHPLPLDRADHAFVEMVLSGPSIIKTTLDR